MQIRTLSEVIPRWVILHVMSHSIRSTLLGKKVQPHLSVDAVFHPWVVLGGEMALHHVVSVTADSTKPNMHR